MTVFSDNVNAMVDQKSDNGITGFQNPRGTVKSVGGTSAIKQNVNNILLASAINGMSDEKKKELGSGNMIQVRSFIERARNNDQQTVSEYTNNNQ